MSPPPPAVAAPFDPPAEGLLQEPIHLGNGSGPADGRHHFTVDVEEYFQVAALEGLIPRAYWPRLEGRVESSVDRILELMAARRATGTFFVLGWVADRCPAMVKRIAAAGHEVASHGWDHRRVPAQTPEEFRRSVGRTRDVLEALTGAPVVGFRAPSFSLLPGHEWALDVLIEEGYRYDSSLFPIRRPGYGYPHGSRSPYRIRRASGRIAEFPPATLRRLGVNLPAAGGGYLRFFPYRFIQTAVRELEEAGSVATLYIHPWELDAAQPRLKAPLLTRLRHYGGLGRTEYCIARLLEDFRFRPISSSLSAQ